MALNFTRIWLIVYLVTLCLVSYSCSTTPSSSQTPVKPQPPTSSNQTTSKSESQASQATKSSEEKAQKEKAAKEKASLKTDSGKSSAENAAEEDTAEVDQGTNNVEGAAPRPDESTVPTPHTQPAALPATKTEEEKALELNQKLNKSLSTFDGKLLKERQILQDQQPSGSRRGTQGDMDTTDTLGSGSEGESISGETPGGSPGTEEKPQGVTQGGRSTRQRGGVPPTPPDIPDGKDDDIIARQLREAAENETDPALREKLWEEYRKYKRGGG